MGPASRKRGGGCRAGGREAESRASTRGARWDGGRGVARREGGAQRAGPHPLTRARATRPPTRTHTTPATGSPTPTPPLARPACEEADRPIRARQPRGSRRPHTRARGRAARRGDSPPPPRGAAPTFGQRARGGPRCPARGTVAPVRPQRPRTPPVEARGPAEARLRAPPAGAGAGVAHATRRPKRRRPKPAGAPAPPETGDRDRGRGPRAGPHPRPRGEGRATGRAEVDLHTHVARTPAREGPPGRTRAHARAERGNATRGEDGPPPRRRQRPRHTPRGRAAAGPGSEAHRRGGRAPTRCGRAGREKTRRRARQAAERGGGRRGTPLAQPTATRTHAGISPPAASEHEDGPTWHLERPTRPSAIPADPPPPHPVARGQCAPGTRSPPQHAAKADPNPPGAHRAPRGAPPTRSRRRAPWGRGHRANQRGRRRRPQKAEPGSGPDGAANSVEAGEPLGEERIGRRRAGKRGTRQARSQGATGTRAQGTRGGLLGQKPQAQPGHQENTATGSHRHRHEGGPAAPRLGRRTALGQPTEQPPHEPRVLPPGAPRQPQPEAQHQGPHIARLSSVPDPVPLRETGAPPPWGRLAPQEPGGPTPRHANAVTGTGRGSARERAESRLTAASRAGRSATRTRRSRQPFPNPLGTSGPAQRDPPPTRKGVGAGHSRRRAARSAPTAGSGGTLTFSPASSPRGGSSGGGGLSASESLRQRYHNAERGGRPGDPVPQGTPLGSLEKAFSPRVGHTPHPPVAPRRAHRGARGHLGKGGGVWREEQEPAATLSVHGQGRGPAGARAHSPRRPPAVHPPPCCEVKHLQRTHTRPVGGRTAAPRRPAGARVAGPSPPRPLTRPALTRQRGGTGRALAGPGGALPRVGRGASHSTASAHTQRTPSGPTRRHRGGDRRRGRWGWERHTTARPRAPEGQPGALQEHRKGPGRASARATPERAARRAGGTAPPPPRRGAAREATTTRGESKGCLLRQRTPPTPAERHEADSGGGTARSGRVPHPSASQRTAHRRGRETGGPPRAGREERVPFTMNGRPSPAAARSRPGRARHHHIDQGKQPRSGVGQSATASPEASEQISLTTPSSREGAADNPAETRNA